MEDNLYRQAIVISKPSAEAYEFIPSEDLILSLGGKHPLRNIFSVSQYLDFEYEKLKRLKEEIAKSKLKCPDFIDDAFLLRIIHGSGYKTRKAFKDLKKSIEAFKVLVPNDILVLYPKALIVLKTGFLYIHGRDIFHRPAIVLDCTKVDIKKYPIEMYIDATVFLMQFVVENMIIPGKVENWVNLVEMNHQGLTELPLKSLMKLTGVLQDLYKCRLAHSFIINPPSSIYYIWKLFSPFIDRVTQSKIIIVKEGVGQEMMKIYDLNQLEKRFGGTSENLIEFWPPVFPAETHRPESDFKEKKKKKTVMKSEEVSECESLKEDSIVSEAKSRHSEQEILHEEYDNLEVNSNLHIQQEENEEDHNNVELEIKLESGFDDSEKSERRRRRKEKKEKRKRAKENNSGIELEKANEIVLSVESTQNVEKKEIVEGGMLLETKDSMAICGCEVSKCLTF